MNAGDAQAAMPADAEVVVRSGGVRNGATTVVADAVVLAAEQHDASLLRLERPGDRHCAAADRCCAARHSTTRRGFT